VAAEECRNIMTRRSQTQASRSTASMALFLATMVATALGCGSRDSGTGDGALGNSGTGGFAGAGGMVGPGTGGAGGVGGAGATVGTGGAAGAPMLEVVELDPTFGVDGIATFSILDGMWTSEGARAVAVMPDDRIVVAGTTHDSTFGPNHGFAALLDDDGALDVSFGEDSTGFVRESLDENTEYSAVTLDGGGRILIAGWTKSYSPSACAFTLARYLADGSRDNAFGNDPALAGVTRLSEPCFVEGTDIAVDSDGRIVATGIACEWTKRFSAVRVLSDGTPDAAFGDNGVLLMDPGYSEEVLVSSDADGATRILVGGSVGEIGFNGTLDFTIAGLADDGSFDATFGDGGRVVTDFGDGSPGHSESLNAMALTPAGRILTAGWAQLRSNFAEPWRYAYDFLVAAYDPAGALDEAFGDGGSVLIDFGSDSEEAVEVLHRPNGNIVVVGASRPSLWERQIAIAHLSADGSPVEGEHKTLTGLEGAGLNAAGAILDNRGRLLVVGYVVYEGGGVDVVVARYVFRGI